MFGSTRSTKAPFLTRFIFGSIGLFLGYRLLLVLFIGGLLVAGSLMNWYNGKTCLSGNSAFGYCAAATSAGKARQQHETLLRFAESNGLPLVDVGKGNSANANGQLKPVVCNPKKDKKCKLKLANSSTPTDRTIVPYSALLDADLKSVEAMPTLGQILDRKEWNDKEAKWFAFIVFAGLLLLILVLLILYAIVRFLSGLLKRRKEAKQGQLESTHELKSIHV